MTLSRHFLGSVVFAFEQETVYDGEAGGGGGGVVWPAVLRVRHSVDCAAAPRAGENKTQAKRPGREKEKKKKRTQS